MMNAISVMLKPVSGLCDMRCTYCFYADEIKHRTHSNYGKMSYETLGAIIKKCLSAVSYECTFAFQGGEPMLAGLDFYKQAVSFVKEFNVNKCTVNFAFQTNGLNIDDEWAFFFARNRFLIGVSLDGTAETHDKNRIDANGAATHERVINALNILTAHGVDFNILTTVTADFVSKYDEVKKFYHDKRYHYLQYIPCLDAMGEAREGQSYSMTPKLYERFLRRCFDDWYKCAMKGKKRYNRYFDSLLLIMDGQRADICGLNGGCEKQYAIEADGSVFPCDFYMLDIYKLGNLVTDSFEELELKRAEAGFGQKDIPLEECSGCNWNKFCGYGGCRRDRDYFEKGMGINFYCGTYKAFFAYVYPKLLEIYRRYGFCGSI